MVDVIKVAVVGNTGAGKTSLLLQLTGEYFFEDHQPTIGADWFVHTITLETQERVKLQLWDFAGQDLFLTLFRKYYQGVHAIAIVVDSTGTPEETKATLQKWRNEVRQYAQEDTKVFVILTKADLRPTPLITAEDLLHILPDGNNGVYDLPLFITSAKTGHNVIDTFIAIALSVKSSAMRREIELGYVDITEEPEQPQNMSTSRCCIIL